MATQITDRARAEAAPRAETAREPEVRPYPGYKALWMWLLLGWVASGADRTITGPVVTYMIDAKVPIMPAPRTRSRSAASSAACCSPATCSRSSRAATSAIASGIAP